MKLHGVDFDTPVIRDFCKQWKIMELSVFGSILRDDFRPDSDVDVLAVFQTGADWEVEDIIEMQEELGRVFGRRVDFVERKDVERSANYIRRKHILTTAERIHAEG